MAGEESFVLVCGDHVFSDGSLEDLVRSHAPAALVDPAPSRDAWEEGTRVVARGSRAVEFAKGIDQPAVDCGAFLLQSPRHPHHQ